jgi:hypothetical protein
VGKFVAEIAIRTVCRSGSNSIGWVKILDGQVDSKLFLAILCKIRDHELSQVNTLDVSAGVCCVLLNNKLLSHHLSFFIDHSKFCTFGNHDNAMSFLLSSFNNSFINTMATIELEVYFRDKADVDISTGQYGINSNVSAMSSHKSNNADSIFSCFSFGNSRVNKLDRFLYCCLEPKASINQRNVIVDGLRNAADGDANVLFK